MGDREDSPDWLRAFQPPSRSVTTLSSDSEVSLDKSPTRDYTSEDDDTSNIKSSKKKTGKALKKEESLDKPRKTSPRNHSVLAISSDSDSDSNAAIREEVKDDPSFHELSDSIQTEDIHEEETASKVVKKGKSPKKQPEVAEDKRKEKRITSPVQIDEAIKENGNGDSTSKVDKKRKSPKKRQKVENGEPADPDQAKENFKTEGEVGDIDAAEQGLPEKHILSRVSTSTLALVLPEKVSRSKALVECEGESIDLSGDMGAVGRVMIPETSSGKPELFLDLKGTIYKTTIVPSGTFCVVSIGQSEAKIEAIMNDFIQLKPQSNVYDAETMVEGTLEGFSFDSEDEADKKAKDVKADQNEGDEEQTAGKKPKGKAEKKPGATQRKGKAAAAKLPKKRKPLATKKGKAKK